MASDKKDRLPADAARRFRHHEIAIADGGKLVLRVDGSIAQFDSAGATGGKWAPSEPEWAGHAIRFGLRPQAETTLPQGRRAPAPRPTE